ncbi:Tigger transposable element-derived protein 1 [Nosema granulosis]|uniref:Tigger transposable element-derived protein 1 n=1 Tax=Nosema granulosis TaxID=83296 RepID=A0A9P6GXS4_9MICR|nr:Tigger transposable element-derived protein 1 [Nosema granulosis]
MIKENRKILLTLNNVSVHPLDLEFSNIELLYFSPGLTSLIQPLDQGIIKSFKTLYTENLNLKNNHIMESNKDVSYYDLIKTIKLVDSLKLVLESLIGVSKDTIVNRYENSLKNSMLTSDDLQRNAEYGVSEFDFRLLMKRSLLVKSNKKFYF